MGPARFHCATLLTIKNSLLSKLSAGPAQQDFEWGGLSVSQIFFFFFLGGGGGGEGLGEQRHATLGKLGF